MPKPSVDFGYPTEPHGKIPAFNSIEEEAEFWDTHDFTDYLDDMEPVEIEVGPELSGWIGVRLDPATRRELARRAEAHGTTPAALAQTWIEERLRQEAATR